MSYIRVRQRNQLTLPKEISSVLQVKEGDFLEVSTSENAVILRPTRIVKFGTPESEEQDRRAEQDFREGRYRTFDSVESFAKALGLPPEAQVSVQAADSSSVDPMGLRGPSRKVRVKQGAVLGLDSVKQLVETVLTEAGGDAKAAGERLEQAIRVLESSKRLEAAAVK